MNTCRTCKYWGRNANMIGAGTCTNVDALMKLNVGNHGFYTAQNFGCVDHTQGDPVANLFSNEETEQILARFTRSSV